MSFLKALGWTAAGVGAVVLAPVTGGGSVAALIGAAGTTTAAGAAIGAAGGLGTYAATKAAEASSERERADRHAEEARNSEARATAAEEQRRRDNKRYKAKIRDLQAQNEEMVRKHLAALEELQSHKLSVDESRILVMVAAAAAHIDGTVSPEEQESAIQSIQLLCSNPRRVPKLVRDCFANPPGFNEVLELVYAQDDVHVLRRLHFVLDVVTMSDEELAPEEENFIRLFEDHARLKGALA